MVATITEYDPDDSWEPVEDTDFEGPEVTENPRPERGADENLKKQ